MSPAPFETTFRDRLIPVLASGLIRFIHSTLRIRYVNFEAMDRMNRESRRFVMAFWHGHLLMMIYARFALPLACMISQHRDGRLIARTMERFGVVVAHGSSTRGGMAALRAMLKHAAAGANLAITPDGPKGPRRIAQPGVVMAAQLSGHPVIPVAFAAKKKSF